jgi:hypothetical protein
MRGLVHLVIVVAALAVVSACGGGGKAPPGPELDYTLFETTKALDAETLAAISSISDDRKTLIFSTSTPLLDALKPKDVLLSGLTDKTPEGLLAQVDALEQTADGVVIHAEPTTVFHAFRKLHVRIEDTPIAGPITERPLPGPRRPIGASRSALSVPIPLGMDPFDKEIFDGDGLATEEDRVDAHGKMTDTVTLTFWLSFDWGDLTPEAAFSALGSVLDDLDDLFSGKPPDLGDVLHLETGFKIKGDTSILLDMHGSSALAFDRTIPLSNVVLGAIPIGPLVFVPTVTLDAHFVGGTPGEMVVDWGVDANLAIGFEYAYDSGLTPYLKGPVFTSKTPSAMVTASANVRAELILRLNLQLYGFFGPYAEVTGFGEVDLDRHASPCWHLSAGVSGGVGASIGVFGHVLKQLAGPSFPIGDPLELGSGECKPPPNPAPTDEMITPWSKSYTETLWSLGTDEDFANLERAHDGRLLLTNATGKAVLKVKEDGDLVWARSFVQPDRRDFPVLYPQHAVPTLDAGILVATREHVLVKLDQAGALEWAAQIETDNAEAGWWDAVRVGDAIWLGGAYSPPNSDPITRQAWLLGLAPDGSVAFSWTWGSPEYREAIRHIVPLDDGALIVGEAESYTASSGRGFIMRLNGDGTIRWAKNVDDCSSEDLVLATAIHTMDDNFIIGGWFYATHTNGLLFRVSSAGAESAPAWATRTDVPGEILGPEISSIHQLPTGELRVVGRYAEPTTNHTFVAMTDSIGRFSWLRRYGGTAGTAPPTSIITSQGGILIATGSANLGVYPGDAWLFEVPAPTGMMSFPSGTDVAVDTPATTSAPACLTLVDATESAIPLAVELSIVNVRAEATSPIVRSQ